MPKDIRKEISFALGKEKENVKSEEFIVNQIINVIKQMEMDPVRLEKYKEDEISDDIKNRLQFVLEMNNIIIEREARGGFAKEQIGEMDFFIYKNENHRYIPLAIGENKVWGNFENQIKQLLGYANRNINFGFTITINKNTTYEKIREAQKNILSQFDLTGKFHIIDIAETSDMVISTHAIPEDARQFKIYHFILNTNVQARKEVALASRKRTIKNVPKSIIEKPQPENKNVNELCNDILNRISKNVTFEDMIEILKQLDEILLEDECIEVIKKFKNIGTNKRRKSQVFIDNKKFSNIQIFNQVDTPIMGFCEKIRNKRDMPSIAVSIDSTIDKYKKFDSYNEYIIKKEYLIKALEIVQNKYGLLDLLKNKKIDIFISPKKMRRFKLIFIQRLVQ